MGVQVLLCKTVFHFLCFVKFKVDFKQEDRSMFLYAGIYSTISNSAQVENRFKRFFPIYQIKAIPKRN